MDNRWYRSMGNPRAERSRADAAALVFLAGLLAVACSGRGGGGGGGGGNPGGSGSLAGGLRTAANPAQGTTVRNVLALGDRYVIETDPGAARQLAADLWTALSRPARWVAPSNPLYTFTFYEDPSFLPGPLYRYTGFDVHAGQVVVNTIGRYRAADGRGPFVAASVVTWDSNPEFLVLAGDSRLAHATEHFNGMPLELGYEAKER